jgi:hypothetical protein
MNEREKMPIEKRLMSLLLTITMISKIILAALLAILLIYLQ